MAVRVGPGHSVTALSGNLVTPGIQIPAVPQHLHYYAQLIPASVIKYSGISNLYADNICSKEKSGMRRAYLELPLRRGFYFVTAVPEGSFLCFFPPPA